MTATLLRSPSKNHVTFTVQASELSNKLLSRYNISNFDRVKITVDSKTDPLDKLFIEDTDIHSALRSLSKIIK